MLYCKQHLLTVMITLYTELVNMSELLFTTLSKLTQWLYKLIWICYKYSQGFAAQTYNNINRWRRQIKSLFLYSPPAGVWPLHSKTKHNLKIFVIFSSDRWWWTPCEKQDLPNIRTVVLLIFVTVFIRWWWWHFDEIRRLHSNATTDTEHFTWTWTKN